MESWESGPCDAATVAALARATGFPQPVAEILVRRGIRSADEAQRFLQPRLSDLADPLLLPDMAPAVDLLAGAVRRRDAVCLYGDYDADGVSAAALLSRVLTPFDVPVRVFIPHRIDHGYGVTPDGLADCLAIDRPRLLVTVDCGTNSLDVLKPLPAAGIGVVVTDHHRHTTGEPAPYPVVNPARLASGGVLSGVGVAFKVAHALVKRLRDDGVAAAAGVDLRMWLDLVALGTVADVVPLVGENRILVAHGVRRLNQAEQRSGWARALLDAAACQDAVSAGTLGFVLGPRMNAAGRMGDAGAAVRLLVSDSADEQQTLAGQLEQANRERRQVEGAVLAVAERDVQAMLEAGPREGLVVAASGWHPGVIGIVASRLKEAHNRPVAVVSLDADGGGKGSCRGPVCGDLMVALERCREHLAGFGGHRMAAGIVVKPGCLEAFRAAFADACREGYPRGDNACMVRIDAWLNGLAQVDQSLVDGLARLDPFGEGNPVPLLGIRHLRVAGEPVRMGKDGRHVRFRVEHAKQSMQAVAFGWGDRPLPSGVIDVAAELRENTFRERTQIELLVRHVRSHAP